MSESVVDPTSAGILEELAQRNVRRLVHFTSAKNLPHILTLKNIYSAAELERRQVALHLPTDFERYDGHPDKISFSIEMPNAFYFRQAQHKSHVRNYPDWVLIQVRPRVAAQPGTLFSPVNASRGSGAYLHPGVAGLLDCYRLREDRGSRILSRSNSHLLASPTDIQAEVMVPGSVPISNIIAVTTPSEETTRQERSRLVLLGIDPDQVKWTISSALFSVSSVVGAVHNGNPVQEVSFPAAKGAP